MFEAENNAVEGRRIFEVESLQKCYTVGVRHAQTAGLVADNRRIIEKGASSMES